MERQIRNPKRRRGRAPRNPEADALRWLARRPLTRGEVEDRLRRRGYEEREVGLVLERLERAGYLDEARLAEQFIVSRAQRLGHARERLLRDLQGRGVRRSVAEAAWDRAVREEDLDPLEPLRKRLQLQLDRSGGRLGVRDYRRLYNALLRAGFDDRTVRRELEPHRAFDLESDGNDDDLR